MMTNETYMPDQTFLKDEEIQKLAAELGTPFYLYDAARIRQHAAEVKEAFAWNSGHQQFFPVGANPNPMVLKMLCETGCGAAVSSAAELSLAIKCGFKPQQILYHVLFPRPVDIAAIAQYRPTLVLNGADLVPIFAEKKLLSESVYLRWNLGKPDVLATSAYSRATREKCGMLESDLIEAAKMLMHYGVKKIGLCTAYGKNQPVRTYYPFIARQLFQETAALQQAGISVQMLNMMGGLETDYRHLESPPTLVEAASEIQQLRDEILAPIGMDKLPIHTEIGRYLMGPCAIMVSTVLHVRRINRDFVAVDASAADLFRPMQYSGYHHVSIVGKNDITGRRYCDVVGPMYTNGDRFAERRILPEVVPGDLCIFHDTGAHCAGSIYSTGGYWRCGEYLRQEDGSVIQIGKPLGPD